MTAAYGRADQKGAVIGTLRSLGALARAFGPLVSSFGKQFLKFSSNNICKQYSEIIKFCNSFFCVWSRPVLLHWRCRSNNSVRSTASIAVVSVLWLIVI